MSLAAALGITAFTAFAVLCAVLCYAACVAGGRANDRMAGLSKEDKKGGNNEST